MAQENVGKRFEGYQIYDRHYEKVGKVEDLFVDENDVPEYIGVKTGLFGGPSTLIPMDIVRVNILTIVFTTTLPMPPISLVLLPRRGYLTRVLSHGVFDAVLCLIV